MALYSAFNTAVSTTIALSDNVPENYKDARATPDVADWMKACDVEMGKLRSLGCWEVIPRSTLPPNASVMKSRWTFRYKTNELGNRKSVSHRSRFVAKVTPRYKVCTTSRITLQLPLSSRYAYCSRSQAFQTFKYYNMTYLLPSFKANSTQTIRQFIANVQKDTKIDENTCIVFIADRKSVV